MTKRKKTKKERRNFSAEFKIEAAKLVVEQGMTRSKVAEDLGITPTQVGKWVSDYQNDGPSAFPGQGRLSPQDQKIRDLENEVKRLRMERDILKKAAAYFAGEMA